jgi:NifU-like protein involved in Fe-S cluster formation
MIDDLYSSKLLKLAANLPHAGRLAEPEGSSEKVSKLCGSRVTVDVVMDGDRVGQFAQDVKACALGQASAAVLGAHVLGATLAEIEMARDQFRAMLKDGADCACWTFFGPRNARAREGLPGPPHLDAAGVRGRDRRCPAGEHPN